VNEEIFGVIVLALATVLVLAFVDPGGHLLTTPPSVKFVEPFRYDPLGHDIFHLNQEVVTLENPSDEPLDMSGWKLRNERWVAYTFPDGYVLRPGALVTIHTGCGEDTQEDLYWCSSAPVWNDEEGEASLVTSTGRVVATYTYDKPCPTCGIQF
jgi:hypothetical protein